jgi:hypothetical protein
MAEFYTGENNSAPLIGVIVALSTVAGVLLLWRLAFRFSRGTLNLSDYLITTALVSLPRPVHSRLVREA